MCAGWRESFESFNSDAGPPIARKTLDRINNDGHYSCGHCEECVKHGWKFNVRWATRLQQNRNKRSNRNITHNGKTMCFQAWADFAKINVDTLRKRIDNGWDFNDAVLPSTDPNLRWEAAKMHNSKIKERFSGRS